MCGKYLLGKQPKCYLTLSDRESCDLISSIFMVHTQSICHFVIYGVLTKNGLLNFTKFSHWLLPTHLSSKHLDSAYVKQGLRISNLRSTREFLLFIDVGPTMTN